MRSLNSSRPARLKGFDFAKVRGDLLALMNGTARGCFGANAVLDLILPNTSFTIWITCFYPLPLFRTLIMSF
jgi:hypothetical protein